MHNKTYLRISIRTKCLQKITIGIYFTSERHVFFVKLCITDNTSDTKSYIKQQVVMLNNLMLSTGTIHYILCNIHTSHNSLAVALSK